jgi:hypothetical protein
MLIRTRMRLNPAVAAAPRSSQKPELRKSKGIMHALSRFFTVLFLVSLLIGSGLTAGCTAPAKSPGSVPVATNASGTVEKVEVYHFHGDQQCTSCIAVGDLAEKTVNANFKDELASGRLIFAHVNYDLPENTGLAKKYGVTGSSLWIGIYDTNGFHKQQNLDVWSLTNDKKMYETYLSAIISKRLNGDLS